MGGKSGGSAKMDVTDYYLSVHAGICMGPVDLLGIYVGDKPAWEGNQTAEGGIAINKPSLFGGNKKEGGLKGVAYFLPGHPPSAAVSLPENLAKRLGKTPDTCPAFKGFASLFFVESIAKAAGAFMWGSNSPYLKTVWAKVRRRSNTFPAKAGEPSNYSNMGSESNPAHMIYECLTDTEWGMGASPNIIDVASFQDAAKTLYQEGFGLSMIWTRQASIESFIGEIIDHIQANLYPDPRTGLMTLKLIRDDYNPDDLQSLTPDNCRITKFDRKAWGETINEIIVSWTNPANEQDETVTMHDLANIEMQGGIVSDTRNYYGIRSQDLAVKIAVRDSRSAAAPLATFDIEADRSMSWLRPGSVVKLSYPEYGISGLVLRVGPIDYGKPGDSKIRFTALEDIFGLPQSAYTSPVESQWQSEAADPADLEYVVGFTLPRYFAAIVVNQFTLTPADYPESLLGVLGASQIRDTRSYDLWTEGVNTVGDPEMFEVGTKPIMARSVTTVALNAEVQTTLTGAQIGMPNVTVGATPSNASFVLIGGEDGDQAEIAIFSNVSDDLNSFTLERGVLDTVPREWPAGTPVWYLTDAGLWGDRTYYAEGSDIDFQLTPSTSLGTLDLDDAAVHTVTVSARPHLPTRPADVKIDGQGFGFIFHTTTGDLSVTWSNRNRLTEDSQVVFWNDGDVTPESGQTTKITVMDLDRNVLTVHDNLTGTSFTLPFASLAGEAVVIIRVSSERDGLESLQAHELIVSDGTGYGTDYGNDYGGT